MARHPVADRERDGRALPLAAAFQVPDGAMHSFEAANSEINRLLWVTGAGIRRSPVYRGLRCSRPMECVPPGPRAGGARMTESDARVELGRTYYRPGDELAGAFVFPGGPPADAESVELSVLWHTSGRGTEDLEVVFYRGWAVADGTLAGHWAMRLACPGAD